MCLYEVLTASEAEQLYGLGRNTIAKWCERGKFRKDEYRKSGRTWLVTQQAMERILPSKDDADLNITSLTIVGVLFEKPEDARKNVTLSYKVYRSNLGEHYVVPHWEATTKGVILHFVPVRNFSISEGMLVENSFHFDNELRLNKKDVRVPTEHWITGMFDRDLTRLDASTLL
ncbi:MAG: helix-turn-helix domain-containing protein [Bacilli bacterium]